MPTGWNQVCTLFLSSGEVLRVTPEEVLVGNGNAFESTAGNDWTGGSIWEGSEVLANLLSEEPSRIQGKRVLELGSGCGLPGLVAGALGAKEVTLTDEVLHMAEHNLKANFLSRPDMLQRFKLHELSWGNMEHMAALGPPYDVILCSDIFHEDNLKSLADTIVGLSAPGTRVLLSAPHDQSKAGSRFIWQFYCMLWESGFSITEIEQDARKVKRAKVSSDSGSTYDRGIISIVELVCS